MGNRRQGKGKEEGRRVCIKERWMGMSFCGAKNFGYVGTCACGKTKQESAS